MNHLRKPRFTIGQRPASMTPAHHATHVVDDLCVMVMEELTAMIDFALAIGAADELNATKAALTALHAKAATEHLVFDADS